MRDRPFLCAWLFLAGSLAATCVIAWGDLRWDEETRLNVFAAAALLVAGAVLRLGSSRLLDPELVRTVQIPALTLGTVTVASSWAAFWVSDLKESGFQLVLLAIPAGAVLLLALRTMRLRAEAPLWGALGISAVLAAGGASGQYVWIAGEFLPSAKVALGASLGCAVFALLSARPIVRSWLGDVAPGSSIALPRVIAAGFVLGSAPVWALLLERYYGPCGCGCSGMSSAYSATLVASTLGLFGLGPFLASTLLEESS